MSIRQPLSWWLAAAALLVCLAGGQLACRLLHPPDPGPQSIEELCRRLEQANLSLHVVQVTDATEEAGVYLCSQPHTREEVQRLLRTPECAPRWRGVVFCCRQGVKARVPQDVLHSWGPHGMLVGDLLFFGDPILLEWIRRVILPDGAAPAGRPPVRTIPILVGTSSVQA